jgi:cytoskeleton protein RodZ
VLNIRYVYLQAIEDGEFNKLPGNAYAIGFLRSYAEYLGLDSGDLVTRFKAEVAGLASQTQLVFPTPVPEGKVPGAALILVSVLFFGLAYGAWSFFSKEDGQVADLVPSVPARLQDLLAEEQAGVNVAPTEPMSDAETGSAETALPDLSAAEVEPGAEVGPATELEPGGEVTSSEPDAVEPATLATTPFETAPIESDAVPAGSNGAEPETAGGATASADPTQPVETTAPSESSDDIPVAAPAPEAGPAQQAAAPPALETPPATIATAPEPQAIPAAPSTGETAVSSGPLEAQVYGRGNVGTRIILRATQDSWVQVRDRNEDLLFTRVLRAGDSYQVPNQSGLTLLTGNAGGLEVEVDGTALGALGPVGTVRRNVALEPAGLLDGSTPAQ